LCAHGSLATPYMLTFGFTKIYDRHFVRPTIDVTSS
jgi:hypothetical protein